MSHKYDDESDETPEFADEFEEAGYNEGAVRPPFKRRAK